MKFIIYYCIALNSLLRIYESMAGYTLCGTSSYKIYEYARSYVMVMFPPLLSFLKSKIYYLTESYKF